MSTANRGARKDAIKRLTLKRIATAGIHKVKQTGNELQQASAEELSDTEYGEQKIQATVEELTAVAGDVSPGSARSSVIRFRSAHEVAASRNRNVPPEEPEGHFHKPTIDDGTRPASVREKRKENYVAAKHSSATSIAAPEKQSETDFGAITTLGQGNTSEKQKHSVQKQRMEKFREQYIHQGAIQQHLQKKNPNKAKAVRLPAVGRRQTASKGIRQTTNVVWQRIRVLAAKVISRVSSMAWPVLLIGVIVLLVVLMFGSIAAIVGSPMGILFADETEDPHSIPLATIVTGINQEFSDALQAEMTAHPECEEVNVQYLYPDGMSWYSYWPEIIALYAVDTNLSAGEDVIVIDEESQNQIRDIFWQMHRIESTVEMIELPPVESEDSEEEVTEDNIASSEPEPTAEPQPQYRFVLHVTVSGRTVDELAADHLFNTEQYEVLHELLSDSMRPSLMELVSGVNGGTLSWPLPGYTTITTIFGVHDAFGNPGHKGIDIAAPEWTPICAAHSGTVIRSGWSDSYGNHVYLEGENGLVTRYAHMVESAVSVGESIFAGQVIGYVGNTGWSTGAHLHFEVIQNGNPVDPLSVISRNG